MVILQSFLSNKNLPKKITNGNCKYNSGKKEFTIIFLILSYKVDIVH